MRNTRYLIRMSALPLALTFPARVAARATGSDPSGSPSTTSTWGEAISIVVVLLVLILGIGAAVKLYDHKRKREEEALSAQAYLADAFLREFGTLPVAASVSGSLWRRQAPLVLSIHGTVPTPEVREAIMRLARQELSRQHPTARAEDHLFVNPLSAKERAGRMAS